MIIFLMMVKNLEQHFSFNSIIFQINTIIFSKLQPRKRSFLKKTKNERAKIKFSGTLIFLFVILLK